LTMATSAVSVVQLVDIHASGCPASYLGTGLCEIGCNEERGK
jgi:hypothetical protein